MEFEIKTPGPLVRRKNLHGDKLIYDRCLIVIEHNRSQCFSTTSPNTGGRHQRDTPPCQRWNSRTEVIMVADRTRPIMAVFEIHVACLTFFISFYLL